MYTCKWYVLGTDYLLPFLQKNIDIKYLMYMPLFTIISGYIWLSVINVRIFLGIKNTCTINSILNNRMYNRYGI